MATKDSLPKPITAADDVKEAPHTVMILKRPYENVQDQYSMGKELGRGQYGVIRECKDKMTGVPFACKSISKTKLSGTREVEDVQREIKVMEVLRGHSAVIELHATYEDQKRVHLIMELCEGGELFERISQRHHYPEDEAALLTRTLISVVQHCQAHGLMHRDLKPENILLVNRKSHTQVKVVDYGLAAFVKPGGKLTTMAGSAYYIAPEVLNNNYGMEADMWSVGVILYILLCGLPPFWAEKEEGIFEAIKTGKVDVFSGGWESVSMDAKDLVLRMLTRDPQKRITPEKALAHRWIKQHCSNAADHLPGLPAKPVTADSRAHRKVDSPRIPLPDGDRRGSSSSSSSSRNIASSSASRSGGAGGYRYGKDGDLATVLASADLAAVADAVAAIRASGAGEERKEELAALLKLQAKLKAKEGAGGDGGAAGGSSSRRPESASAASSRRSARDVERALAGALAAKGGGGSSDRARRSSSNMSRTKTADTGALLAALADLQDGGGGGGGGGERGGGRHRRTGSRGTDAGEDEEERKRHRDRDRDGGKGGKKQDDSVKEMFAAAKDALRGKEKDGGAGKEDKERLAKLLAKMEEVKAWEKDRTGARPSSSASRSSRRGDDGDEKGGRDRDGAASSRFPRDSSTSSRSSNADRLSRYRSDAASMLGALEEETGKDDASSQSGRGRDRDRSRDRDRDRGKDKVPTTPGSLRRDKADSSSKSKKSSGGGGIIRHKSADISKMLNVGGDDGDGGGRKSRGGRDTDSLAGGIGKSGGGGGRSSGRKMERSASNQSQLLLGQQSAEGRGSDGGRSGGAARRGLDRSRSPDGKGRSDEDSVSSPSRPPTGSRLRGTGSSSRRHMESPSGSGGSGRERSGGAGSGRSLQVLEESDAEGGGWTTGKNAGESPGSGKEKKGGGDEAKASGRGGIPKSPRQGGGAGVPLRSPKRGGRDGEDADDSALSRNKSVSASWLEAEEVKRGEGGGHERGERDGRRERGGRRGGEDGGEFGGFGGGGRERGGGWDDDDRSDRSRERNRDRDRDRYRERDRDKDWLREKDGRRESGGGSGVSSSSSRRGSEAGGSSALRGRRQKSQDLSLLVPQAREGEGDYPVRICFRHCSANPCSHRPTTTTNHPQLLRSLPLLGLLPYFHLPPPPLPLAASHSHHDLASSCRSQARAFHRFCGAHRSFSPVHNLSSFRTVTMFRSAKRVLLPAARAAAGVARIHGSAAASAESASLAEAYKRVAPQLDVPSTPLTYLKERPAVSAAIPEKLTLNLSLPHAMPYSAKEVDSVIIPATSGQMGVLPGHVASIAELKPGLLTVIEGTTETKLFVSSGFAFVHPNSVLDVAAVDAVPLDQIDGEEVKKGLAAAHAKVASASTDLEKAEAQISVDVHTIPALLAELMRTPQGPLDALTWRSKGVQDAPPPSMASRALTLFGQTASFEDTRGKILRVSMGQGVVVNLMATKAGSRRSGDMHNCSQHDIILSGRTNLHLTDLVSGGEEVREYDGILNVITIPPRVPHMFHFLEDNLMIEWWDCDFQAWYYRPYRDIVEA
ncbi:unnamed protein product [Closterium sp. NIES-65]|nr:unnamed protein product [Closterium sp. NIES-65]